MADFEGLIRQALARQNASDPAVRESIYQASRSAFARMVTSAGPQSPNVIQTQREALENSIRRIEAGYIVAMHPPSDDQPNGTEEEVPAEEESLTRPTADIRDNGPSRSKSAPDRHRDDAALNMNHGQADAGHVPPLLGASREGFEEIEPVRADFAADDDFSDPSEFAADDEEILLDDERPSRYHRERGGTRRILAIVAAVCLIALIGWLAYSLVQMLSPGTAVQTEPDSAPPLVDQLSGDATPSQSVYITVLSPTDTSALQTAGRGKAELLDDSGLERIRLSSIRAQGALAEPAKPILIDIQPGVLERIAGSRVTMEILAKSGGSGPATFSVSCNFEGQEACGRKRFRIGLQPEAIVFALDVPAGATNATEANFAINTDVTGSASITGQGDVIDILYARLRLPEQ